MFTEEMPWLRGDDLDLVMGEALMRWFKWRPSPGVDVNPARSGAGAMGSDT
jgi:hypothetical protein